MSLLILRGSVKVQLKPIVACFLLVFYLLGSHAGAHGLAWCLGAGGHTHLERLPSSCDSGARLESCETADVCVVSTFGHPPHSSHQAECRHLPVSSLHSPLAQIVLKSGLGSPSDAPPAWLQPSLRLQTTVDLFAIHQLPKVPPPTQALAALRTVVLLN